MVSKAFDRIYDSFRDFIRNIFDTPVKPYYFKANQQFTKKFLNYFIYDDCIFINRGSTSALIFKVPSDQFVEFIKALTFINYKTYLFLGFNWVTEFTGNNSPKSELYFWIVKQGSLTCIGLDECYTKLCSYKDKYIDKIFKDLNISYKSIDGEGLISLLEDISFLIKKKTYDGEEPLINYIDIPSVILRDNLFYTAKKEIYMVYSMKSFVSRDIKDILYRFPFSFDFNRFYVGIPYKLNTSYIIYRNSENVVDFASFLSFKFLDGMNYYLSNYNRKDEYGFLDFSDFTREIDYNILDSLGDAGFVFQREQKNLAFIYHMLSLPFNSPYFEDISVVDRFLSVEV